MGADAAALLLLLLLFWLWRVEEGRLYVILHSGIRANGNRMAPERERTGEGGRKSEREKERGRYILNQSITLEICTNTET